jgi:hypothetical protein
MEFLKASKSKWHGAHFSIVMGGETLKGKVKVEGLGIP